jgi:hypothetical protein
MVDPDEDMIAHLPQGGLDPKALLYQIEKDYYRLVLGRAEGIREQVADLSGLNGAAFLKTLREWLRVRGGCLCSTRCTNRS